MSRVTRPVTFARHGMVSSPHYLASAAGLRCLQDGGSAVDAAISTCATLGVVYPHMVGVGGDAFWLIYDAAAHRLHALNGSGRAAAVATPELFRSAGQQVIPSRGPLAAVTVPGAVDSWSEAYERFGRLPWAELLAPATAYAREGYPVSEELARWTADEAELLGGDPAVRAAFLPDGRPPRPGQIARHPDLAATLEAVADQGRDAFYRGPIAKAMVDALQQAGGYWDYDDLANHRSDWVEPISTTYRDYTCYQHPPNSQGFSLLLILNILEGFAVEQLGDRSADYVHAVVEATKLAFADRDRCLSDPEFCSIPLDELLSKEYASELRRSIRSESAAPLATTAVSGDTICTVVVDGDGNAVSTIQSLYDDFGSAFIAGDTGVLLQNRGSFFSLDEGHVNCVAPGKRTFHTLMPGMLFRDGEPTVVYGTMGGEGQAQTHAALVTRLADFGANIQSAIDAPRWVQGRTIGPNTSALRIESRFSPQAIAGLRSRGHPVEVLGEWDDTMGHAAGIVIDSAEGVLAGGADPRGDGIALGW